MPETQTIDLTAEDVTQLTWDELTLLMLGGKRTDTQYDPYSPISPEATAAPPCSSNCCSACDCHQGDGDFGPFTP